jgi:hypothetical protein
MSEKGANIDLLFRNGLKDYEVLPPPDVWNGINSSIKVKTRPVIFMSAAAMIAILVTIGFFTFRWSNEISKTPPSVLSFNVAEPVPVYSYPTDRPQFELKNVIDKAEIVSQNSNDITYQSVVEMTSGEKAVPLQVSGIKEAKILSVVNQKSRKSLMFSSLNQANSGPENLNYSDLQYLPALPDNTPAKKAERWSIAAMASPTYYSRITSGSDDLSNQLISSEEPLFSYSGGVSFSYKISRRLTIQSGLYYSSLGQKIDGINSFSGFGQYNSSKGDHSFEVLTANGTVFTSNPDVFLSSNASSRIVTDYTTEVFDPKKASLQPVNTSLNQNFSYLEFPVVLKYKIVDKTIGINLIGGLSYNLLVNNTVTTTMNGSLYPVGDTKGLNPLSLSSSFGMGMEYNISGKLSLNLEPTFRYYLNPFSVTTGSYIHPYSFGIFSGVSYKF